MSVSDTVSHSSLIDDLRQLGRVLTLRRPLPGSFNPSISKLPWLVLLYCLMSIALSIALNGWEDGAISLDGMVLVPFVGVAVAAGLLKWIDGRQDAEDVWLVFTLLLLMLPLAEFIAETVGAAMSGLPFFANAQDALPSFTSWCASTLPLCIAVLPYIWLALAGALYVAHGKQSSRWLCCLPVPLTLLALFAVFASADPLAIWQVNPAASKTDSTNAITLDEEVFYVQSRLLDEQLAMLEAGKPGVPEIFFLGVAGSEENVFMNEILSVEQLFRERYATAGHSMILVNNPATAREFPFASHESFSLSLRRIGEQMNREEDLLFLFLTTHGSADHQLSIKLQPLKFSDFTPEVIRKALDDAGIKHRVIVISACFSGGFIPALADENTLVITAAAADRNSFGCDDTNELTDFGRAYFEEALSETRSFTEAFERAKAIIIAREAASDSTPSNPQMVGGESLRAKLEWFARE